MRVICRKPSASSARPLARFWGYPIRPLTIRPDLWHQGIAKLLMEPILHCFTTRGIRHSGLFTFSQSTKHLYLYQKFGFYPRFLTAILSKPVASSEPVIEWSRFSEGEESEQAAVLQACQEVTEAIYEGLEVGGEIQAVFEQLLGETVLLWGRSRLIGFASGVNLGHQEAHQRLLPPASVLRW